MIRNTKWWGLRSSRLTSINKSYLGKHCFVFEDNTLQPFVTIGNVVISGLCDVGRNTFIGVNAALADKVTIGEDNWIGIGATIVNDTGPD